MRNLVGEVGMAGDEVAINCTFPPPIAFSSKLNSIVRFVFCMNCNAAGGLDDIAHRAR